MNRIWLTALACAACSASHKRTDAPVLPAEGIEIAIYQHGDAGWATVDDRRTIEVNGDSILLDRIDAAAPLPSLVIEPLVARRDELAITACVRERLDGSLPALSNAHDAAEVEAGLEAPRRAQAAVRGGTMSPLVRCQVHGRPGKHLVRILHVVPLSRAANQLVYRAQHEVVVAGGERATVATRYAIATPRWDARAKVAMYDGVPGGDEPPKLLARGEIALDGGVAIVELPRQELPAHLRYIFDGGARTASVDGKDVAWRRESHPVVWVALELEGTFPPGPVHVHHEAEPAKGGPLEIHDVDVGATVREQIGKTVRLPLYIDESLRGARQHWVDRADGSSLTDRFQLAVSNLGDTAHEVWIEEHLRPARRRDVAHARPAKPAVGKEVARTVVTIAPHGTERVSYTINYEF